MYSGQHISLSCRHSGFNPQTTHVILGVKTWLSTLETVSISLVVAEWLERHFKTWASSFTPRCQCLSDETLKAVGPFYLVSMPGEVKDPKIV